MDLIYALLLLVAAGCFAVAAYKYSKGQQGKTLLAAGLLAWVLVPLLQALQALDR